MLRLRLLFAPGDQVARLDLARAERELGLPERSLDTISRALGRDPNWAPAIRHAIELQLQLGREPEARRTIEQITDVNRFSDDDFLSIWLLVRSDGPELTAPLSNKLLGRASPDRAASASASGTRAQADGADPLYRFGFICFSRADHPGEGEPWSEGLASWRRLDLDGFVIHHHPETPVRDHRGDGGAIVLLGHAFAAPADRTVEGVLSELLDAETDDAVFDSLDTLSGRFALFLFKDSVDRVFHDPAGSRSVFYRSSGALCVGSHAELVAAAFGDRESAAVRELIATDEYNRRNVRYLPGDLTAYENVYALAPNNYYEIGDRRTVRYWPRHGRQSTTFEDFFTELDAYFVALVSYLREGYSPIVGVTGGVDSRALIAALSHHGLRLRGVTWLDQGTTERELPAVMAVAAHTGLEHTYMRFRDATEDDSGDLVAAAARRNLGYFMSKGGPGLTVRMRERFAGPGAVFIRGGGAEILRGFYPLGKFFAPYTADRPPSSPSASELFRAYTGRKGGDQGDGSWQRIGRAAFEGFVERANYDDRLPRFGFELSDVFYWEHRVGIWGPGRHNQLDPALLPMIGYNSRKIYEAAFGMDSEERRTKELLIRVIRRYDPSLAEIPFF